MEGGCVEGGELNRGLNKGKGIWGLIRLLGYDWGKGGGWLDRLGIFVAGGGRD